MLLSAQHFRLELYQPKLVFIIILNKVWFSLSDAKLPFVFSFGFFPFLGLIGY